MRDYQRWLENCSRVPAHSMRFGLWCEALAGWSAEEAASLIDFAACAARRDAHALAAWLTLADFPALLERVGALRLHELFEEAERLELAAAILVLGTGERRKVADSLGPPPDRLIESMSLGMRKTAARGVRGKVLERLLKDPSPEVVAEVLRNPRLREREVVEIASRRPAPEALFWHLAAAPQWMAREAVRRTVALNPYAPPRLAVTLAVTLSAPDLRLAWEQEGLHRVVREGALEIYGWGEREG